MPIESLGGSRPTSSPLVITSQIRRILDLGQFLPFKFVLIALVFLLPALPAFAATLTVSGTCTLEIAWASAVANSDQTGCTASGTYGDDTIELTGDVTINSATPLTLPTGNPGAVTITGNNHTYTVSHASGQHFLVQGSTLTINDLTLTGGNGGGGPGGAIEVTRFGTVNINRSVIHGNSTTTDGGAIYIDRGTVTIKRSVFYNNTATRAGGAIHSSGGVLTLDNSTLYNNSSPTGQIQLGDTTGGEGARGASTTTIRHITMAGCLGTTASNYSGINFSAISTSTFELSNSIIWCQTVGAGACNYGQHGEREQDNIEENIINSSSTYQSVAACLLDRVTGDPNLPTPTNGLSVLALPAGSPAIDAADTDVCTAVGNIDQRGVTRPQGSACDIGAYEYEPPVAPTASFIATVDTNNVLRWRFDASGSTGDITSYAWNFGDGNTGTGATTSHTYASGGNYSVTLTVTGSGGSDSTSQTLAVSQPVTAPTASFSVSVSGYEARFTSTSTGSNLAFSWDVDGDGSPDYTTQNPTHTYPSGAATYRVTLTVSNTAGTSNAFQDVMVPSARQSPGTVQGRSRSIASVPVVTPKPPPRRQTCLDLPAHIRVRNITVSTQCQQLGRDGIGNADLLAAGFRDGLDVWGWVLPNMEVCFATSYGTFKFVDTTPLPRVIYDVPAVGVGNMICTTIDRPGIVALMPGPTAPMATAIPPASWTLSNCMVRTKYMLNLRAGPGGAVIGAVPYDVTLTAFSRTADWFEVDYLGARGWVSNGYLEANGDCG